MVRPNNFAKGVFVVKIGGKIRFSQTNIKKIKNGHVIIISCYHAKRQNTIRIQCFPGGFVNKKLKVHFQGSVGLQSADICVCLGLSKQQHDGLNRQRNGKG